jgi:hypothetical protein
MKLNTKLWLYFLVIILIGGCQKKQGILTQTQTDAYTSDNSETHEGLGGEEQSNEDIIINEPTEEIKVGITLRLDPSFYDDKVVYVNRSVPGLKFFKIHLISIEGLGQLEFLETVIFGYISKLSDLTFLEEIPHLKRLFIDYGSQNIDWSFIGQLPDLEVLHINYYDQPTINIDLKNNEHLEYVGFTLGSLEMFPTLLNMPNSLKYINLESNKITSLPSEFEVPSYTTVLMGINPFKKDETTPNNVTVEFYSKVLEQKYLEPSNLPYINGLDFPRKR